MGCPWLEAPPMLEKQSRQLPFDVSDRLYAAAYQIRTTINCQAYRSARRR